MMSKSNPYQEVDNSLLSIQPWPHLQQKQKQQLLPAVLLPRVLDSDGCPEKKHGFLLFVKVVLKTIKVKLFLHPQSCWTRCHYLVTVRSFPVVTCWSLTPVSDPTLQKFSPGGKITLQTTWRGFIVFFAFSSIDPSSVHSHRAPFQCCSWHNRTPGYEDTVEIC